MGKIAGWDLWQKDHNECGTCGMLKDEMKNGCCKDEYQYVKLKVDQKTFDKVICDFFPFLISAIPYYNIVYPPILNRINSSSSLNNPALRNWSVPLYVRNCLFLI